MTTNVDLRDQPSALEQLRAACATRGWAFDDFRNFRMEDDDGDGGDGGGDDGGDDDGDGGDNKTFNQDQVNKIATREKKEGERAGVRKFLEGLGLKDAKVDDIKALIEKAKSIDDKALSDAEKAKKEADEAKAAADKERAEAAKERRDAKVERMLIRKGIRDNKLNKAIRFLDIEEDDEEDDIEEKVDSLVEEEPSWFGTEDDDTSDKNGNPKKKGSGLPGADPKSGGPRNKGGSKSKAEAAKEVLHRRHPHLANKS